MIRAVVIQRALGRISLMKFFPSDPQIRAQLGEMLGEMCSTEEEVEWVAKRIADVFVEWPGASEMRALFCSKFRPLDGVEVYSEIYPDGIPSEHPEREIKLLGGTEQKLLEGSVTSAETERAKVEGQRLTAALSGARNLPPAAPENRGVPDPNCLTCAGSGWKIPGYVRCDCDIQKPPEEPVPQTLAEVADFIGRKSQKLQADVDKRCSDLESVVAPFVQDTIRKSPEQLAAELEELKKALQ